MDVLALFSNLNLETILQESLYIGLPVIMLLASLGLPIPEDVSLMLAGCLARLGYGHWQIVILIGFIAVVVGDTIIYMAGRRFGRGVLKIWPFSRMVTRTHLAQMKLLFRKRGHIIIFFGRFFVGIRTVMCLTAGVSRVPIWKFLLIDGSGAAVTVPLLVGLGWYFSHTIRNVFNDIVAYEHIAGAALAALLVGWVIYIHMTKTRNKAVNRQLAKDPAFNPKTETNDDSQADSSDRTERAVADDGPDAGPTAGGDDSSV